MTQTVPLHRHGAAWRVNCSISSEIAFLITNRDRDFFMVQLIIHHQKVANIRTSSSAYQKDSPSLTANTATFGAHLTSILIASAFPWMPCNSLSAVAWKLIPTFCSKNWKDEFTSCSHVMISYEEYKQKRFVNMFACEKFPKCQVKVQIALKILEIVNFFLKFSRVSKNLFDVLNSQKNSGIL